MKKNTNNSILRQILLWCVAATLILSLAFVFLNTAGKKYGTESLSAVEKALFRAAVSCYAIEGFYPPSVDYLKEHYGLSIDTKKYIIEYNVFSENVLPDMVVLKIGGENE